MTCVCTHERYVHHKSGCGIGRCPCKKYERSIRVPVPTKKQSLGKVYSQTEIDKPEKKRKYETIMENMIVGDDT